MTNRCVFCNREFMAQRPTRAKYCSELCKTRYRLGYQGWNERTIDQRLKNRIVAAANCCWQWTGAVSNNGYGRIGWRANGWTRSFQVHRVAYETWVGPIAEGLHIDHTCDNRICINPAHLEAVTQAENNRRIWARGRR